MVSRRNYYDDDEHFTSRHSNRGHEYHLSRERDQALPAPQHPPYARQNASSQNVNSHRQSPEQDAVSAPRRRIPVACGRCRKRKIRCSGDPGNGQQCVNCKTANNDDCQFLRVSSTEAKLKNDGTDFGYDSLTTTAVSRAHCRMSPYGPQQSYTPHITSVGPGCPSYSHASASIYQPVKYYSSLFNGDFTDDHVNYTIPVSNYSIANQDPINISYTAARWVQPQFSKNNSLFMEQDSSYNSPPPYSHPFPYRPSMSTESKSLSIHNMPNALSPSISGTDRLLPAPAPLNYRQSQAAGSYFRSAENALNTPHAPVYSNNGLINNSMLSSAKALSASSSTDSMVSSNYLPLSSSPPESIPSSHMSYDTNPASSQNHDIYTPSQETRRLYDQNNGSADNLNYVSHSRSHLPSIPSQGEESQSGSEIGTLVNGYQYLPPLADNQTAYPQPPMPLRLSEQSSVQPSSRQSVSAS